jgi:hypothetical protein
MQKVNLLACVATVTLSILSSSVFASESDELRERAKAMQREAAELAERGQADQSADLMRKAEELMHQAEKLAARQEIDVKEDNAKKKPAILELSRRLQALRETLDTMQRNGAPEDKVRGVQTEMKAVTEKLALLKKEGHVSQSKNPEMKPQMEKLERAWKQVEHIRQAAEHLKMAELHDMAHQLMERAENIERDVRAAKERMAVEERELKKREVREKDAAPGQNIVREMRAEIERLRDEVNALKKQLRKE